MAFTQRRPILAEPAGITPIEPKPLACLLVCHSRVTSCQNTTAR